MVQNYISFLKLAKKDEIIIPTFDTDLIWHTHIRYPSSYQMMSTAPCGFLLDHDDSLKNDILDDAYQKTAEQWKMTTSSCAMIVAPVVIYSSGGNDGEGGDGCGGGCGSC
ncbi:unnamed protein product [Rotaria sp. Silwood1]|nr:unnamed protein product [Rotaria sp. Silwood1]CAF4729899.1 unnamed protein product [Rotaria sp. Silwood1]CAF4939227.1 unnamed protein product [Rotaria sp. Silwood1]CAF5162198.1 unnamed protein product [Rotaria sp. Silwood1]